MLNDYAVVLSEQSLLLKLFKFQCNNPLIRQK